MDKKLSRVELIQQLQAISAEGGTRELMSGAMCYCPARPNYDDDEEEDLLRLFDRFRRKKIVWCNKCYRLIICDREPNEIKELVKSIASMGYDVRVKSYCKKCCKKLKEKLYPGIDDKLIIGEKYTYTINIPLEKRNYVFLFRADSNEAYHRAIANDSLYYKYVHDYLEHASNRGDSINGCHFTRWQRLVVEYMTGLKIDE